MLVNQGWKTVEAKGEVFTYKVVMGTLWFTRSTARNNYGKLWKKTPKREYEIIGFGSGSDDEYILKMLKQKNTFIKWI